MALQRLTIGAEAGFWPAAARAVLGFAQDSGCPARQLQTITWITLPHHAPCARRALSAELATAFLPPRILPLAQWLGLPLSSGVAARADLFAALRANRWVRELFGAQPAALWSLARGITAIADELTWAAAGNVDAFEGRLHAALARHFHDRAARVLQPQAQLVLQLWRARRGEDAIARVFEALQARARQAAAPIVYTALDGSDGWEESFLGAWARRAPALLLTLDCAAAVRARPLLTAAWPELAGAGEGDAAPIGARGQALAAASAPGGLSDLGNSSGSSDDPPAPALAILRARSLEEEAQAIARQVLEWRAAGIASIGLVALDRLTARRVRALLERAGVNVRDETGWKLSTTSAAAAVMRWFDLVAEGGYWRDLLDWLKSPFSLHGLEGKAAAVSAIERAIRLEGVIAGASAARRALSYECERVPPERETDGEESQSRARARDLLGLIEGEIARTQRAAPNFRAQIGALAEALDALGLRAGLQADPVGRAVLREIAALEAELAPLAGRIAHDDFRALLAQRFEEAAYVDEADGASMTSIVMISLQASLTRPFAAAVLIGADAAHLPALPESAFFLNDALRAELGLRSFDTERARQGRCLAALLCTAPRVTASWRESVDEPNALSPWLERLRFVARCCGADPVTEASAALAAAGFTVDAAPVARPAPRAAALLRDTVSVSQAQSLVDCGYQFYARHLLRLARLDDVVESPDQRDFGELIHAVLNRFHSALGPVDFGACDANELARSLRAEARAVFEPRLRHTPGVLELARRFDGLVAGYVEWLRAIAVPGWRWRASEEKRARDLELADGRRVALIGRLDRIDAGADGRARVIDYKARRADLLKTALRAPGEDVQLPLYGLLCAESEEAAYLSLARARDGDPGVREIAPPGDFVALRDRVGERLRRDLTRIAAGAPLDAIGIDAVCAYCEMRGLCRRGYWPRPLPGTDQ